MKAKYTGDGSQFLNGVPARDLTEDECAALDAEARKLVRSSGLYDVATEAARAEKEAK